MFNLDTLMHWRFIAASLLLLLASVSATAQESQSSEANYFNCLDGPYGCELDLLTDAQRTQVEQAELRRNYFNCLDGPHGCELDLLTDAQQAVVATARESRADSKAAKTSCAENGSCYGDISKATGRPKTFTLAVNYRRDGTYVRGHYRSRPRR